MSDDGSLPLSKLELEELRRLLIRFCFADLDQWEMWRIHTPHGQVYVEIMRKKPADVPDSEFTDLN